jgi:hypothetical protein
VNVGPTLDGSLRIDADGAADWAVLRCITLDAGGQPVDLATRLGRLIRNEPEPGDWEEFVVPELREQFDGQLETVGRAIESALGDDPEEGGSISIARSDAEAWYGALNQARLALEAEYQLGGMGDAAPDRSDTGRRSAHFRSQFYLAVQEMLLQFVMDR